MARRLHAAPAIMWWRSRRTHALSPLVAAALISAACARAHPVSTAWEVGYWYWRPPAGQTTLAGSAVTPDLLYVHVGGLSPGLVAESRWPGVVPLAKAYLVTWRSDEASPPDRTLIPSIVESYSRLQATAARGGHRVVGLQLDVDCPTRSLPGYAAFLGELRRRLEGDTRLSITALLDWFRSGTRVREVVVAVDEYVPQFYDADPLGPGGRIAEPLELERWAPIFNGLGRRYRLGVSTFGRVQRLRPRADGIVERSAFRDVKLLDLWASGLRPTRVAGNAAGEQVIGWEVRGGLPPGLKARDRVEAIVPTSVSVQRAHAAARAFGSPCAGIVFFRWPGPGETLVMDPDEVATSLYGTATSAAPRLHVSDGECGGRACADLTVQVSARFRAQPIDLRVAASDDVEYVVPRHAVVTLRQVGPRAVLVSMPAFLGERDVLVGRVFLRRPARFSVVAGAS